MEEEFVPHEQSLKLKQLGFKEVWFRTYNKDRELNKIPKWHPDLNYIQEHPNICLAPLWQQAFDWFREEYDLFLWVYKYKKFFGYSDGKGSTINHIDYETYEEARLACLKTLIEIIDK